MRQLAFAVSVLSMTKKGSLSLPLKLMSSSGGHETDQYLEKSQDGCNKLPLCSDCHAVICASGSA